MTIRQWLGPLMALCIGACAPAWAKTKSQVVDVPSRPGVTQRFLYIAPADPQAAVILYAGGHGGLGITEGGALQWGRGNFLVRSRERFADHTRGRGHRRPVGSARRTVSRRLSATHRACDRQFNGIEDEVVTRIAAWITAR